jgi:uncharacterized protein YndB with AHSA1/START domain
MSQATVSAAEPLRLTLDLDCPVEHAFAVWTERIDTWWPSDHTVSGAAGAQVVLQPGVGGRIFERAPDGTEHEWGRVTSWSPPTELGYTWHLRRAPADATDVLIRFVEQAGGRTRLEIEHRGWERLGSDSGAWRSRNVVGWESLLPHYVHALRRGDA